MKAQQVPDDMVMIRGKKYLKRQLTEQELFEITRVNDLGWESAVCLHMVENNNAETQAGSLFAISKQRGYPHEWMGNWQEHLNKFLYGKELPYRLASLTRGRITENTIVRFYRRTEKSE